MLFTLNKSCYISFPSLLIRVLLNTSCHIIVTVLSDMLSGPFFLNFPTHVRWNLNLFLLYLQADLVVGYYRRLTELFPSADALKHHSGYLRWPRHSSRNAFNWSTKWLCAGGAMRGFTLAMALSLCQLPLAFPWTVLVTTSITSTHLNTPTNTAPFSVPSLP